MKIIKKYIFISFLKPFLCGLFISLLLIIITHFFDFLHVFLDRRPPVNLFLTYFLNRIPEWVIMIMPVAVLLGILFSLGSLNRHQELTAVKGSGIKIIYILKPVIIFSIFLSVLSGIISELVVPETNLRAETLFLKIRGKRPRMVLDIRENFTYVGEDRRLYIIKKFENKTISGLQIIEFFAASSRQKRLIVAEVAIHQGEYWILKNGAIREFSYDDGNIKSYRKFDTFKLNVKETPQNFTKPEKPPEEMDFFALLSHIRKLRSGGFSTLKDRVLLHHKIAFPFSNAIILILGIPMALWGGMKSRVTGFFFSLIVCFIYWGAISVGRALAIAGTLPPVLGAWSANITFFIISLIMIKTSNEL